ncbi:protein numb-like [Glandiceps talaboti]
MMRELREVPKDIAAVDKCYITDRCRRLFHSTQSRSGGGVRVGTNNFHRSFRKSIRKSFRMKKLRRTLSKRESYVPECSKPHQWQEDEKSVRAGTCNFPVKYLGSMEVTESRGMPICEAAVRKLKDSGRKKVRAVLWVSSDGLRVVDEDNKGLIVDQTIEKVSFCAPDRNNERAFSYICRDGTTRRWLCHAFIASRDSGERLSHAVGCAFSACLERKQRRDKECGVKVEFDVNKTSFARQGSFREPTLTEKLEQQRREAEEKSRTEIIPPPVQPVHLPNAVPRRHASAQMLERQGSFRGFPSLGTIQSPFKRQLSLRLNELPSTLQRQKDLQSLQEESGSPTSSLSPTSPNRMPPGSQFQAFQQPTTMQPVAATQKNNVQQEDITSMCQQLSMGLSELSQREPIMTDFPGNNARSPTTDVGTNAAVFSPTRQAPQQRSYVTSPTAMSNSVLPIRQMNPWESPTAAAAQPAQPKPAWTPGHRRQLSDADKWLETAHQTAVATNSPGNPFANTEGSPASNVVKSQSSPHNLSGGQRNTPTSDRPQLVKSHTINDPFMPMQGSRLQQPWQTGGNQMNGVNAQQQTNYMNVNAKMARSSPNTQQRTFNGGLNSGWANDMTHSLPAQNPAASSRHIQQPTFEAKWEAFSGVQNQPANQGSSFGGRNVVKTFEIDL